MATASEWPCLACTTLNEDWRSLCEMCGAAKHSAASPLAVVEANFPGEEDLVVKATALKHEATDLARNGKLGSALGKLTDAIALTSDDATLYGNRSALHLALKDGTKAMLDAKQCIELRPMWCKGHLRLASALVRLGHYEEALDSCDKALQRRPDQATIAALNRLMSKCESAGFARIDATRTDPAALLPIECFSHILAFFDAWELGRCAQVSKLWEQLVDDPHVWKAFASPLLNGAMPREFSSWKHCFAQMHWTTDRLQRELDEHFTNKCMDSMKSKGFNISVKKKAAKSTEPYVCRLYDRMARGVYPPIRLDEIALLRLPCVARCYRGSDTIKPRQFEYQYRYGPFPELAEVIINVYTGIAALASLGDIALALHIKGMIKHEAVRKPAIKRVAPEDLFSELDIGIGGSRDDELGGHAVMDSELVPDAIGLWIVQPFSTRQGGPQYANAIGYNSREVWVYSIRKFTSGLRFHANDWREVTRDDLQRFRYTYPI